MACCACGPDIKLPSLKNPRGGGPGCCLFVLVPKGDQGGGLQPPGNPHHMPWSSDGVHGDVGSYKAPPMTTPGPCQDLERLTFVAAVLWHVLCQSW